MATNSHQDQESHLWPTSKLNPPDRLATAARYQGSITTLTCTAIHHLQGTQGPPEAKAISHLWFFWRGGKSSHREIPQKTGITVRVVRCLRYTFFGDKKPMITNKKCKTNGSGDFCNGPRNVCTYTYKYIYIFKKRSAFLKYLYTI